MKTAILEKIFSILADNNIKIHIDNDNDIIIDTDRVRMFQDKCYQFNYAWKSIDDFLFKPYVDFRYSTVYSTFNNFLNKKWYCNYNIFDLFKLLDDAYIHTPPQLRKPEFLNEQQRYHNANKVLKCIRGNSLEELLIKLDLIGV